jgi:hypothetical protein
MVYCAKPSRLALHLKYPEVLNKSANVIKSAKRIVAGIDLNLGNEKWEKSFITIN